MRALIVGAGSVGVVYAHALRRGGADVAFFVKPAHEAAVRAGVELRELKLGQAAALPVRLQDVPTFTDWREAAKQAPWDWLIVTVAPPALREPGFATGLTSALSEHTQVLGLVLGLGDEAFLTEALGPGRLSFGQIALISYSLPLDVPGPHPLSTAFFVPPFGRAPLSGADPQKVNALAEAFTRGGLPTTVVPDARGNSRLAAALVFAAVSSLQLVGWRFNALAGSDALWLGLAAAREREAILTRSGAGQPPALLALVSPPVIRAALWSAAKVLPLPLETYLRVHFTKVNAQFVTDRERLIASGRELGVATPNLEALHRRLGVG